MMTLRAKSRMFDVTLYSASLT